MSASLNRTFKCSSPNEDTRRHEKTCDVARRGWREHSRRLDEKERSKAQSREGRGRGQKGLASFDAHFAASVIATRRAVPRITAAQSSWSRRGWRTAVFGGETAFLRKKGEVTLIEAQGGCGKECEMKGGDCSVREAIANVQFGRPQHGRVTRT